MKLSFPCFCFVQSLFSRFFLWFLVHIFMIFLILSIIIWVVVKISTSGISNCAENVSDSYWVLNSSLSPRRLMVCGAVVLKRKKWRNFFQEFFGQKLFFNFFYWLFKSIYFSQFFSKAFCSKKYFLFCWLLKFFFSEIKRILEEKPIIYYKNSIFAEENICASRKISVSL